MLGLGLAGASCSPQRAVCPGPRHTAKMNLTILTARAAAAIRSVPFCHRTVSCAQVQYAMFLRVRWRQNRVVDNYLVNFCSDQLCEQTANDPNEPSKCTTPTDGSDPVCKTYQCSNFSPDVCRERAQALSVFPGEAATAVYFDCEELVCSDCKYATPGSSGMPGRCTGTATDATKTCDLDASTDDTADCPAGCDVEVAEGGCETHATSGCMYEVGTDPAAYFDLWAFALSTCDHCVDTADLQEICGSNDDPPRGFLRESYYAEQNAGLIPDPVSQAPHFIVSFCHTIILTRFVACVASYRYAYATTVTPRQQMPRT